MDQQTLDNIFNPQMHLGIVADVMIGKNLKQHQVTIEKSLEAADFIIEQEGYLQPDIDVVLWAKGYMQNMAAHIEKGIRDPSYRPNLIGE